MTAETKTEETPVVTQKKFFVVGDHYRRPTIDCFSSQPEFTLTENFDEADVFVFTGGADIDPNLYGDRRLSVSHYSSARDKFELEMFSKMPEDKVKIGICRGAQLLNVLAGGRMWQDVNNHAGNHHSMYLKVRNVVEGDVTVINSIHHQMMIPHYEGEVLGVSYESTKRINSRKEIQGTLFVDPEVIWYKKKKHFCFQAHPEFGHKGTTDVFFKLLKNVGIY